MEKIEKLIKKYEAKAETLTAVPADEIIKDLKELKDSGIQWRMVDSEYSKPMTLEEVTKLNSKLY